MPVGEIERRYTTNFRQGVVHSGDIARIADGARFHLRSCSPVLSALFPAQPDFLLALDQLLRRLEFGLPSDALGLMALPIPLSRGEYLALFGAGARSPDTAKALGIETLASCIGAVAAQRIGTPSVETSEIVA